MKLRVLQPGQPPMVVEVEGDSATIGRSADCDVVIRDKHVSKRHVRLLRGLVAVDLGSANGTYVDEERLSEPVLVHSGTLRLGMGGVQIEWGDALEATTVQPFRGPGDPAAPLPSPADTAKLPRPDSASEIQRLRAEVAMLLGRIEALERE